MKVCTKCGRAGRTVELTKDDKIEFSGIICDTCLDECFTELEVLRKRFDALIAGGVSVDMANQILVDEIEGKTIRA